VPTTVSPGIFYLVPDDTRTLPTVLAFTLNHVGYKRLSYSPNVTGALFGAVVAQVEHSSGNEHDNIAVVDVVDASIRSPSVCQ
jgi:hypothetical protein